MDGAFWQQPHKNEHERRKISLSDPITFLMAVNLVYSAFAANSFTDIRTSFSSLLIYT